MESWWWFASGRSAEAPRGSPRTCPRCCGEAKAGSQWRRLQELVARIDDELREQDGEAAPREARPGLRGSIEGKGTLHVVESALKAIGSDNGGATASEYLVASLHYEFAGHLTSLVAAVFFIFLFKKIIHRNTNAMQNWWHSGRLMASWPRAKQKV